MDRFEQQVLDRLPLAEAVWTLLRYVLEDGFLYRLFEEYRETGSQHGLLFSVLVNLVMEALLEHGGSGRRGFAAARQAGRLMVTDRGVYAKLGRLKVSLSEAFLRESTQRLREVLPVGETTSDIPPALRGFRIFMVDGKKVKKLPKRLLPLRSVRGRVLAGKAVAGLLLNEGLIVAMKASLDGEANDAPLTPGLLDQIPEGPGRLLAVADRQFCDLKIPNRIHGQGDAFLIRFSKKMSFFPERERVLEDLPQRQVREAWGYLGRPKDQRRLYVRQITLVRPGEEDVILVTNLMDAEAIPAEVLLELYLARWTIERVFQQITEVFQLQKFIGCTPQGALFQFSLCALLYNLIHVVRRYVAQARQRSSAELSSEMIFRDVCDQMTAGSLLVDAPTIAERCHVQPPLEVRTRLQELLAVPWSDLWIKTPGKRNYTPPLKRAVPGNHSSAWKLITEYRNRSP